MSGADQHDRVSLTLPEFDPRLRTRDDDDPVVQEMVERLRAGVGGLVAVDADGRPMAWRDVVRLALGDAVAELRGARHAGAHPRPGVQAEAVTAVVPSAPAPPDGSLEDVAAEYRRRWRLSSRHAEAVPV